MTDQIDDILAFIDQEDSNPNKSIDDYKTNSTLEREHQRLLSLDNLISKKMNNLRLYPQSERILNQQHQQKEQYVSLIKKILIDKNFITDTKIAEIWNSVFLK